LVYPLPGNFDPALFGTLFTAPFAQFDVHDSWTKFSSFTPKASLEFQWTSDVLAYASYSKGFKSGGYDLRATSATASSVPYRPQITIAYELGLSTSTVAKHLGRARARAQQLGELGLAVPEPPTGV